MRSILALSLVGTTVALPFGDVLNDILGRDPKNIPPPDYFRHHTRRPHPTGTGGFPYPTGTGYFPTATGVGPTGTGGMSILPFPYPTGPKSLSLDYGLPPTTTSDQFSLPTVIPDRDEGDDLDDEDEGEGGPSSFTLANPTFGLPVIPTDDSAPHSTNVFPTFIPTGGLPTGIFPTGIPTGIFPTGYPTGVFPTDGFPSTLLTMTRGPVPTGQPPIPENPTEEDWKAWWVEWLEWAKQFSGKGKHNGN